jgi:hypothetical protein
MWQVGGDLLSVVPPGNKFCDISNEKRVRTTDLGLDVP